MRYFAVAVALLVLAGCADTTVKQPYKAPDLTVEEIRTKLQSEDFRQQLEASKQIDKLEPAEKLRVVLALSKDPRGKTRILAVKKLKAIDDAKARERLEQMAKDDPDPDVKDLAGQKS